MKPAASPALQLRKSPRGARPSATTLGPPFAAAVPALAHREAGTAGRLLLLAVLSLALLLILTALLPAPAASGRSLLRPVADARSTIGGVGVSLLCAAGILFLLIELTAQ